MNHKRKPEVRHSNQTLRRNQIGAAQINIECSPDERTDFKLAALLVGKSLKDFVLNSVRKEVERVKKENTRNFELPICHPESAFAA